MKESMKRAWSYFFMTILVIGGYNLFVWIVLTINE
jgi:hypothetical protein